jgi:DNA replication protein DnaC
VEPKGSHYAKECNVLGEILLSRYDIFIQKHHNNQQPITNNHSKTHITTNLNAQELEKRYGNRVRSRIRAMFNLISFDEDSVDKRK